MEEYYFSPTPITNFLQQTLRSLCIHENSLWVYAVFWRILPRNYPPPNWNFQGEAYDSSRVKKRKWMLAWDDGFCNFVASTARDIDSGSSGSYVHQNFHLQHLISGLQPQLFFKMALEIYNYGEGLIGKVAADNGHRWVHKEHCEEEFSLWKSTGDLQPRTWEAQFQSGIKTIALIGVKEGVLQLGAVKKVAEDLSYVAQLQNTFSYLHSIPGFLLPYPTSSSSSQAIPSKIYGFNNCSPPHHTWPSSHAVDHHDHHPSPSTTKDFSNHHFDQQQLMITPSMASLEELLARLPSVVPTVPSPSLFHFHETPPGIISSLHKQMESGWKEGDE